MGLDLQISPKEAWHRDLHALQLRLNAAESDALLAYLVRSRPDLVGASQEQPGREVRGDLDLGLLLQPEPLLQDPRQPVLDHARKRHVGEEPRHDQQGDQNRRTTPHDLRSISASNFQASLPNGSRERLHDCFELRADALFELTEAILSAGAPGNASMSSS